MLHHVVKILYLFLLTFAVSCQVKIPENVIPPKKMESVLYDYHITQSMASTYANADFKEKLFYIYLYDKHNITKKQFDESFKWYNRYPKHLRNIYKNLEDRLQSEVEILSRAKVMRSEGVAIDVANLEPNIAELWTSHNVKMLTSTPLNNRIVFSFDTPKDSTFIVGDSLVFSFNTTFVPQGGCDIKQEVYAAINLEYNNTKSASKGVKVSESGHYDIAVPRNNSSRLKSMSGYIFYNDSDTAASSKVIISGISVKRLHPVSPKRERNRK